MPPNHNLTQRKIDLSGSIAPFAMPLPHMPAEVWGQADKLRSQFNREAKLFFECDSVLAVTGIESGISGLARLFQTWYGSMRVVLAEPSFDQWDMRFRRANHVVLDWPVELIMEGDLPECDVVILGRPVNPTCQMIDIETIKKIANQFRQQGGWLILDEAYLDWTGEESYTSFIEAVPAIVLRSVAPFTGLAGVNLAFVCAPRNVCSALLNEVGTQAVSAPQWWLALNYFDAEGWRQGQMQRLQQAMERLERLWAPYLDMDVPLHKGGYFVAFSHSMAERWANLLEQHGILVRIYSTELDTILRCGVPKFEEEWQVLQEVLQALLKPIHTDMHR